MSGKQFHLLPYHVRKRQPNVPNPEQLLQIDNREVAFRKFFVVSGEQADDLPNAYNNNDLHDVLAQPFLNYFMLTSGPDEIGDVNLVRIYSRLFERLHARNRNIRKRPQDESKPAAGHKQDEFDRVFKVMAVAAWRTGGTRAASWQEILTEGARAGTFLRTNKSTLRDIFDA